MRTPCSWTPTAAALWAWPWSRRPISRWPRPGGRLHPAGGGRCGAPQRALRGGGLPCPSGAVAALTRTVQARSACSACYASLVRALHTSGVQGLPIAIGQGWRGIPFDGLGIGACCNYAKERVPGCPPPAEGHPARPLRPLLSPTGNAHLISLRSQVRFCVQAANPSKSGIYTGSFLPYNRGDFPARPERSTAMDLLQCLMDSSSHAIFTLDRDGIITHINQQAKVRFGLYHNSQHPHPAGRLEPGDLVLIADTAIGADDGALRPEGSRPYRHPGAQAPRQRPAGGGRRLRHARPAARLQVPARPGRGQPLSGDRL